MTGTGIEHMHDRMSCPAGCGRSVAPGKLLCRPCWGEVPRDVQREVYRTWREYRDTPVHHAVQLASARAAYREARDKAIGAVA